MFTEECLEYYDSKKKDGFRHASVHNNKADCENNQGFWVSFNNYLEEYPSSKTEQACKAASSSKLRLIWAVPYRSEDIDNLKMTGGIIETLLSGSRSSRLQENSSHTNESFRKWSRRHSSPLHLGNSVFPIRPSTKMCAKTEVISHFSNSQYKNILFTLLCKSN